MTPSMLSPLVRTNKLQRALWLLTALLSLTSIQLFGQGQAGTLLGTVTDASGAVLPNVSVTITNTATGVAKTSVTNDAGAYAFPGIQIGNYDVKVTAQGFKASQRNGVAVNATDRVREDFQMAVGGVGETVTVEASGQALQTDSGEQSSLINGKQITELATKNRTIYSYAELTVGAANLNPSTQVPVPVGGASGNISFNGNRPGHNLYMLDGGENSDRGGAGSSSVLPSMDAIAETKVLTSNYSAEYGISSGGTISSVTKSGTKQFHASAWEFFQNDALQAHNYFDPTNAKKGEFRYNVFGFNVGGPVVKDKLFFFYNMEWRRLISGSVINQQVPLDITYGGDFSGTENGVNALPTNAKINSSTSPNNGATIPNSGLHAPCANQLSATQQGLWTSAGQAFSTPGPFGCSAITSGPNATLANQPTFAPLNNNLLPFVDANAQALLTAGGNYGGIFPAPTNGNHFQLPVSAPNNLREEITRIDYNATSKLTIYGTFVAEQVAQNLTTSMWSGDNVPSVGNTFGNPSYAGVLHTAYTISPTLLNEASFNYNGNRIHILPAGLVTAPSGFTFAPFFPHTSGTDGENVQTRIPSIQLNGAYNSTGSQYTSNWMPWNNKADSYQIRDDVSWTKGRHQLKMGGGWLYYAKVQDWFKNTQGNFQFNGTYTGNDFADFLLGYASNYTEDAVKSTGYWNNVSWSLYLQDNFRATNRLTLNLGLRWDGLPHTYEAKDRMNNFYPELYNPANAAILSAGNGSIDPLSPGLGNSTDPAVPGQFYVNGIATCGKGVPKGCVNDAWKNFGPRLGFAYDVSGNGKTVIRGGFGLMYERIQGNDVYNNAGTVPLAASVNFNDVFLSDPTAPVASGIPIAGSIPVNNITGLDRTRFKSPASSQFSLGIQHSIGKSVFEVSYVGTQNRHQNYYTETNLVDPSLLPGYQTNSATQVGYNANVPFLGYHSIKQAINGANGDYNSLQTSFRGNLKSDLQYQVGYTYSHTNDAGSQNSSALDLGNLSNPYAGWKYDFGPSPYDIHHVFFTNFVYEIPLLKNSDSKGLKMAFGGWEISGIVQAQSGAPLNIGTSGGDVTGIVPNTSNRPDLTGHGHDPHTLGEWFDTSVFSAAAPGTWGNLPRSAVRGPGRDNWNLSLFKNFWFNQERGTNLQFRAEFFNVWNHTQWNGNQILNGGQGISSNFGASDFGQVKAAYDPRTIQLALKLSF
jgi:Carboxypeptidase regulatory-like domain